MSSRLIVKGLPINMDEPKLRKLFSDRGSVTDCQLKYTPEGKFRKFAFIGFLSEKDAQDAIKYFDQTFLGSTRISVEICRAFGDEGKPRAWSKYAKDSSAFKQANLEDIAIPVDDEITEEATKIDATKDKKRNKSKKEKDDTIFDASDEDYDLIRQLGSLLKSWASDKGITDACVIRKLPTNIKSRVVRDFISPVKAKHIRVLRDTEKGCAVAMITCTRISDLNAVLKRDGNYIGGKQITVTKVINGKMPILDEDEIIELGEGEKTPYESAPQGQEALDSVADTGRLFVRNLSFMASENDIKELFSKFGQVSDVHLVTDKTGQSKGYAHVTMLISEHAVQAYSQLDGSIFQGRMLHIIPGKEKPGDEKSKDVDTSDMTFKDKKAVNLKLMAGKGSTWNTLFLGANSVADALAHAMETNKADILDAHNAGSAQHKNKNKNTKDVSSLGVRMALGETQLVRETREFLQSNGVKVDVFGTKGKLSKHVILVKNLPARTGKETLVERFSKYGDLGRVVLPPSGVTAIMEYMDSQAAAKAFKAQAFARFGPLPLFLEWAPENVFTADVSDTPAPKESSKAQVRSGSPTLEEVLEEQQKQSTSEKIELDQPEQNSSIFVKNLNFDTTDEDLRLKFSRIGQVYSAKVATRKNPKETGSLLSMGYGFVQYMKKDDAARAIREMQGSRLDAHALILKLSTSQIHENTDEKKAHNPKEQGDCTKILVRNIPFQANKAEVLDLFSAFGNVINVRMPSKVVTTNGTKSHRGFGFVTFSTVAGAKQAFEALSHSTHLYARRLVLEWAKDEETVEDVRKRTAHHFETGEHKKAHGKMRKKMEETLNQAVDDEDNMQ